MKLYLLIILIIPITLFAQSKIDTGEYVWSEINTPENLFAANGKYTAICIHNDEIYLSGFKGITSSLLVYKDNKITVLNDSITDSEIVNIFVDKNFIIIETYFSRILISHDNGQTWEYLVGEQNNSRQSLEFFYNNKSIFRAMSTYLLKSDDYGKSWDTVYNKYVEHFVADKKNIMAISHDTLLLSKDNGQTWTAINDFSKYSFSIIDKSIYNKTGYVLLTKIRERSPFKTYEDDPTYTLIHFEKPHIIDNSLKTNDTTNHYDTFEGVSVTTLNNDIYVTTREGLFTTKDMGVTWEVVNRSPALHSAKIYTRKNDLIAFNNFSIFISKDEGKSWKHIPNSITKKYDKTNEGYKPMPLTINDIICVGDTLYAASNWGLFHSTDNGKTWIITTSDLLNCKINSIIKIDNTIVGGVISNRSYMNFKYDITNATTTINNHPYLDNFKTYNDTILASSHRGGYSSSDKGESWERIHDDKLTNLLLYKDTLIAIKHYTKVETSSDFGKTWNNVNVDAFIRSVVFINDTAYTALANRESTFTNSIHTLKRLDFDFYNWTFGIPHDIVSHNESLFIITSFDFEQPDFVHGYIFTSNDRGLTWKQMHKDDIFFRSLNICNGYLYAQGFDGKLYKIKL